MEDRRTQCRARLKFKRDFTTPTRLIIPVQVFSMKIIPESPSCFVGWTIYGHKPRELIKLELRIYVVT